VSSCTVSSISGSGLGAMLGHRFDSVARLVCHGLGDNTMHHSALSYFTGLGHTLYRHLEVAPQPCGGIAVTRHLSHGFISMRFSYVDVFSSVAIS